MAELFSLAGVQVGALTTPAARAGAPGPSAATSAGPRMRARMGSMDRGDNKRVDRRTFLKGGLVAGSVLGTGLAIRAVAEATSDSAPPPSTSPSPPIPRKARRA